MECNKLYKLFVAIKKQSTYNVFTKTLQVLSICIISKQMYNTFIIQPNFKNWYVCPKLSEL